jgi:cytochrome oxidase Cu insertion factor (SCO1/SenC/PrrC family)
MRAPLRRLCLLVLAGAFLAPASRAEVTVVPPDIKRTRGHLVPNVELIAADSTTFHFAILQGKPIIVSPIFTSCPHTCSYITSSLRDALAEIGEPGIGYEVLTVSFDPADGPAQLREYRERLELPDGWRLAVATPENLAALLGAIDFQYAAMDEGGFAHANVITILDPEMKVASYLHGVMYETAALRKELERAARDASLVRKARPLLLVLSALGLLVMISVLVATGRNRRLPA